MFMIFGRKGYLYLCLFIIIIYMFVCMYVLYFIFCNNIVMDFL